MKHFLSPLFSKATLTSALLHGAVIGSVGGLSVLNIKHTDTLSPSPISIEIIEKKEESTVHSMPKLAPRLPKANTAEKAMPQPEKQSSTLKKQAASEPTNLSEISCSGAHMPQPPYPKKALKKRLEGLVKVRFSLDEKGQVKSLTLAQSSSHTALDQAALKAIKTWSFPATIAEKHPDIIAPIRFVL